MTGRYSVSSAIAFAGRNVTVMEHVAPAERLPHVLAARKNVVISIGAPTFTVAVPVFVTEIVCVVAVNPGTSANVRAVG